MAAPEREKYGDAIEPVAIVGIACRFPGDCSTPEQFWDMLAQKRSGHSEVPEDRFNADVWQHPDFDRKGAIQPTSGFFLSQDVSLFDAPFFSITAKEAVGMDPMQRHLLEVAYECFENAGVPMENLPGSATSVYTGVMTGDYERMTQNDIFDLPLNAGSGTSRAMLSNRVSWFFNLAGPSLTLDTACSSSLYALHLACQSIRLGESQQSLVTGVNLILDPNFISQLSSMHMLSPDGISHSFDDRANGYARGEAVGAVLVKPLSKALADGDTIRAVIRGTGANQDGKTPGITMPSGDAQGRLINSVYTAAGLPLDDTTYFEAHGTGTKIGDPIELSALGKSFGQARSPDTPLYVGSVKTNVGHTEGMAGLAGIIKSTLSIEKGVLPGLVGFKKLNPKLLLDEWRLALTKETMPWPAKGLRRASINSFGFGGANAHAVIDDAYHYLEARGLKGHHCTVPDPPNKGLLTNSQATNREEPESSGYKLLPFSTQDQSGIDRLSKTFAAYLALDPSSGERPEINLDDLAFSLANRRSQFDIRSYVVGRSIKDIATSGLKSLAGAKQKRRGQHENMIFVFSGQGAQWPLMGRELMTRPVFAASVARSQQYLKDVGCTWDAVELLNDPSPRINAAEFCQPICSVLQVALVDLLASWNIRPAATIGHSSGEMAAAYGAGAINQKDCIKIAYMRGYYCSQLPTRLKGRRGNMMAAGLTPQEAAQYLELIDEGSVVVACVNSPVSVTLSGDSEGISYLEERIKADGKFARKLKLDVAYHSPHMKTVSEDFLKSLGTIETASEFKASMFSSVTMKKLDSPAALDAAYWVTNMVSAVHFSEAACELLSHSTSSGKSKRKTPVNWFAVLELGPHEALKGPFNQCIAELGGKRAKEGIPYAPMVRRGDPADKSAAEAMGLIWALGHPVDIVQVNNVDESRRKELKVLPNLPPYPWQHSKGFWIEPPAHLASRKKDSPRTDLLGSAVDNQNPHEPHWKNLMRISENPWMKDHTITGTVLYPAAGMLVMALEAALQLAASQERTVRGVEFHNVRFDRGLVIPDSDDAVESSLSIRPHEMLDSWYHWALFSRAPGGTFQKHAWGLMALVDEEEREDKKINSSRWYAENAKFSSIKTKATTKIDPTAFYDQLKTIGMDYGPTFTNVTMAAAVEGENAGYGVITIPDTKSLMPYGHEYSHTIHPATLDAIFHLVFIALFEGKPMPESSIPVTVERIFIATDQPSGSGAQFLGLATAKEINDRDHSGNLVVSDIDWKAPRVIVNNMVVRKVSSSSEPETVGQQMATLPKRTGAISWMEDLDMLDLDTTNRMIENLNKHQTTETIAEISNAAAWLDRACHKSSDLKVLAIVNSIQSADVVARLVSSFAPAPACERRFSKLSIKATTDDVLAHLTNSTGLASSFIDIDILAPATDAAPPAQKGGEKFGLLIFHSDMQTELADGRLAELGAHLNSTGRILMLESANATAFEQVLQKDGFGKVSARVSNEYGSLLVATRPVETPSNEEITVYVLQSAKPSSKVISLRKTLDELSARAGIKLETRMLSETEDLKEQSFISLLEAETPLTINWPAAEFEQFRKLVLSQSYVLWLTRGGFLEKGTQSLQFAPSTGLLRVMRTEIPQIVMPQLDLSPSIDLEAPSTASLVLKTFQATINPKTPSGEGIETEYIESDGKIFIPRVYGNDVLDGELNAHSELPTPIPVPMSVRYQRPLKFVAKGPSGSLTQIQWVEDTAAKQPINDNEVEINTEYVAIDAAGMGGTRGATPKASVGRAASGSVSRLGTAVRDLSIGDKVFFPVFEDTPFSDLKTQLRQQQSLVSKLPSGVRLEDAPRLLNALMNACHCLNNVAKVGSSDSVLLHLLNVDVAHAAFCIAREKGAKVFIAVKSKEEQEILIRHYRVAEQHIFDSTSRIMSRDLLEATDGKGFDAILSDHTGPSRRQASSCVAEGGQYVDLSGSFSMDEMSMDIFDKNVSVSSNDIWRLRRSALEHLFQESCKVLERDTLISRAPRATVFSIGAIDGIWEHLNRWYHSNAVIHFNDDALIPVVPLKPPKPSLDPKATYMIAGGLGALGLEIAMNMATFGARHLVLLSRSGIKTPRQQRGVDTLKERGCQVDCVPCDVIDEEQVKNVVKMGQEKSWSIKGLIQCAVVLYDSIFENMTHDMWVKSLDPKVKGTWNLHTHLPDSLDFFIILSSISGIIGNPAQANYAAGNNYEDAIAHYRRARGLASTTLNVGLVSDAAHFAADSTTFETTIEEYLKRYGHLAPVTVTDREMQLAIEAIMRGDTEVPPQIQVGINSEVPRGDEALNPWSKERKFDLRIERLEASEGDGEKKVSLAEELSLAETGREAVGAMEHALKVHVAAAMTAAAEDIDSEKPLYSFGIDSLKAIQVRNWVFKEVKADVSVFDILAPMPLGQFASDLAKKSSLVSAELKQKIEQEGA